MNTLGLDELEQNIMSWANSCERVYHCYIEYAIQDGESWEEAAGRIVADYLRNECKLTYAAVRQMYKFIPTELIDNMAQDFQDYYAEEIQEWASEH